MLHTVPFELVNRDSNPHLLLRSSEYRESVLLSNCSTNRHSKDGMKIGLSTFCHPGESDQDFSLGGIPRQPVSLSACRLSALAALAAARQARLPACLTC